MKAPHTPISAIYARKSTEQNVSDDAKSVTRQVELARAFAAEKGWQVIEEYVDDGISGVESIKLVRRAAMLAAAAEGKFEALIVRDLDRLSRNDEELPSLIYSLRDSGVEVWAYADRTRVDTRTAMNRTMLSMKAGFAAAEREAAQQRTGEALRRKAAAGHVAGGRVLGYDNVRQGEGGPVVRVVNEAEANIVRRIFTMAAEGKGLLRIAKTLNAEGIKNPTGQSRNGTAKSAGLWSSTGVREILHRDLYRGVVVYGKTRNEYRRGKRVRVEGETPITLDRPELRIISDELWEETHDRMKRTHAVYLRRTGGRLGGKPSSGLESRYLLSGFLRCGVCGGNLIISKTTGKRGRPQTRYICATHKTRGDAACTNQWGVSSTALTDAVLAQLKHVFLHPAALGQAYLSEMEERRKAPEERAAQHAELTAQIARLDTELTRLTNVIASGAGAAPATLLAAIKTREGERRDLRAKLEHLDGLAIADEAFDLGAWLEEMKGYFEDLRQTLEADPVAGRQALRYLLSGPIVVTPRQTAEGLTFDFAGRATYAELPEPVVEGKRVDLMLGMAGVIPDPASPGRVRMVSQDLQGSVLAKRRSVSNMWCPRGDSNTRLAV